MASSFSSHLSSQVHSLPMRTIIIISSLTAAVAASSMHGLDALAYAAELMATGGATTTAAPEVVVDMPLPVQSSSPYRPIARVDTWVAPATASLEDFLVYLDTSSPKPSYRTALFALRSTGFGMDSMTDSQFKCWWLAMLRAERKRLASTHPLPSRPRHPIWDLQNP